MQFAKIQPVQTGISKVTHKVDTGISIIPLRDYEIGNVIDDLHDLMEWLRADKRYDQSDRLRTIMGRLARIVPDDKITVNQDGKVIFVRDIARSYK